MAPYAFPQNQKIQNFNFSEKNHGVFVFWDIKGILLVDFMPPDATSNAAAYCNTLTSHSKQKEGNDVTWRVPAP